MKYLIAIMIWSAINFPITFIAYKYNANFMFSMIYLIGVLGLLIFGFIETKSKLKSQKIVEANSYT